MARNENKGVQIVDNPTLLRTLGIMKTEMNDTEPHQWHKTIAILFLGGLITVPALAALLTPP